MNGKRLIYAEDLLAQFPVGGGVTAARARRAIERAATVDAMRVIRCGECGCWNSETGDCNSVVGLPSPVEADDFCSYGERGETGK